MPACSLDPQWCQKMVESEYWRSRVSVADNGCWLWHGAASKQPGYGSLRCDGRTIYAHRVALVAALRRDIGPGLQVGHKCHDEAVERGECQARPCDHRLCVNPSHLAEQSPSENMAASPITVVGFNLRKTHCPRGHALGEENTVPANSSRGRRSCRTCQRDLAREQSQAISAAAKSLGVTTVAYIAAYGRSRKAALAIVAERAS